VSETIPAGSPGCSGSAPCTFYYLFDGLNSVIGLTDSSGSLVNQYSYGPYGTATKASEQVPNPFRYISAVWDSGTGLYKMGDRYYDASVARFTQEDPLGDEYQYAGNNPINAVDPSGLEIDRPMGTGLGGIPPTGEAPGGEEPPEEKGPREGTGLARAIKQWYRGTFASKAGSLRYHYLKHGWGQGLVQYTQQAEELWKSYRATAKPMVLKDGSRGWKITTPDYYGIYTSDGLIVSFGKR
jgi:RHS repeat-associated protein